MLPASARARPTASAGAGRSTASIIAAKGVAVVATEYGSVAGYIHDGMFTFKGIPYADSTAGANRFMPPVKLSVDGRAQFAAIRQRVSAGRPHRLGQ
jgi:hypothetical protein